MYIRIKRLTLCCVTSPVGNSPPQVGLRLSGLIYEEAHFPIS